MSSGASQSNRIERLFAGAGGRKLLSVFFTAGYPRREDTGRVLAALADAGVDLVEIGFPFSDSLVDGPTIQQANETALRQGMTLDLLFEQVREVR